MSQSKAIRGNTSQMQIVLTAVHSNPVSLIYAAIIEKWQTICLSPEGLRENEQFYSGTPERGMPGEGQSRQKIATLRGDDCYGKKKCLHISRGERERGEGGGQCDTNITASEVYITGSDATCASLC